MNNKKCAESYQIVYPKTWEGDILCAVEIFRKQLEKNWNVAITSCMEGNQEEFQATKLILGNVDCEISREVLQDLKNESYETFGIKSNGQEIALAGGMNAVTLRGMKYFVRTFQKLENLFSMPKHTEKIKLNMKTTFVVKYFAEIKREIQTTVYASGEKFPLEQCTYGKIIKLEHSGENNGILFCTREVELGGSDRYPIYRSDDDGKTWSLVGDVKDEVNAGYLAGWQPFLFELPVKMGKFEAGTLVLAGCSRHETSCIDSTIMTLFVSTDLGQHWELLVNIDMSGGKNRALWEPYLIYDETDEKLYCFYSDDTDPAHNQKLVYKYSTDLAHWLGLNECRENGYTQPIDCIACKKAESRPGMIVFAKMGNGEYFTAFEAGDILGSTGYEVFGKQIKSLSEWEPADFGKLIITEDGKSLGSSPCLAWTPKGGDCGTLVLGGSHMMTGTMKTENDLFLSFDYGKTFVAIDNPVMYQHHQGNRCGYSSGLFTDREGNVYYIANKNSIKYGEDLIFSLLKID